MKDQRTYRIIGAAMEVHRELGQGFLEAVYQEAFEKELTLQHIPFKVHPDVAITYKGQLLEKTYQPDFVCFDEIIVEIKALADLSSTEQAQLINYLKASGLKIGLLINFGAASLQYRRFVF
ncbi:MAG: GxxExxY protein [Deltaproteobacteria bacterium]|nr:GxxExxY protein [Deltaproteobacteria bacterium]